MDDQLCSTGHPDFDPLQITLWIHWKEEPSADKAIANFEGKCWQGVFHPHVDAHTTQHFRVMQRQSPGEKCTTRGRAMPVHIMPSQDNTLISLQDVHTMYMPRYPLGMFVQSKLWSTDGSPTYQRVKHILNLISISLLVLWAWYNSRHHQIVNTSTQSNAAEGINSNTRKLRFPCDSLSSDTHQFGDVARYVEINRVAIERDIVVAKILNPDLYTRDKVHNCINTSHMHYIKCTFAVYICQKYDVYFPKGVQKLFVRK